MTIAACYISPEGVVLGADSTSTYGNPGDPHYYNNAQKVFEIGENNTLGVVTWGLGGLQINSHRTLFALLGDDLLKKPPASVLEVATRWCDQYWAQYSNPTGLIAPQIAVCRILNTKAKFDPKGTPSPLMRTQQEEQAFQQFYRTLVSGFCIAGHVMPDRTPLAYVIVFDPLQGKPVPAALPAGYWFWGVPNMVQRLIFACDDNLKDSLIGSGKWNGTRAELDALVKQHALSHPIIPIRDAIDFIHACVLGTIKAIKFSNQSQTCGGPIEIAVITTDRRLRWVKHKRWDAAITEGES